MRGFPLGVIGVMLATAIMYGGRTQVAAVATRPAAVSGSAVRVKATGETGKTSSLVVPLRPRKDSAGQLAARDRAGKPLGDCPLKRTDVAADIAGFVARVTVTQKYSNPYKEPIEAIYTFPLPEDAAVDDMEMRIGERVIRGDIRRREEARQIYEQAKQRGQAAALLDQERPNIFTQAVANVMPGQDVTITIRYVNTLKYDEGVYAFAFPMVVGPRYVAGAPPRQPGQRGGPSADPNIPDADKITPPIAPPNTRAGHDITLRVNLDAGLPLDKITSVSHDIQVARESESRARVALAAEATIPNKDFILRYTVAGPQMRTGVIAHADGGQGYFTLVLQPPAAPKRAQISAKEIVFVIDQTGSQMGQPLAKAKETMRHAIANLNPGDTFQLIGFNTGVYPCFDRPVNGTAENIRRATEWMETLQAAGGTDILKAAAYALKLPDDPHRPRIICFMTDGYVGNDMEILDYIRNNRGRARMFPFGIGGSVNRFLIEGMAREGRGAAEIVTLDEPGPAAAERFYRRIRNPILLDPRVDWGGLPVANVYPQHIPDVFSDGPIVLKGRYTGAAQGVITVSGLLGGQPWEQRVSVALPAMEARNAALGPLWARARIEELQANDWYGAQSGNPNVALKEEIIQTALEHRLMSQFTSFVAVEKHVVNEGGRQRTVDMPVEMPEGVAYEGIFGETHRRRSLGLSSFGGGIMPATAPMPLPEQTRAGKPATAMSSPQVEDAAPAAAPASVGLNATDRAILQALLQHVFDGVKGDIVLQNASLPATESLTAAIEHGLKTAQMRPVRKGDDNRSPGAETIAEWQRRNATSVPIAGLAASRVIVMVSPAESAQLLAGGSWPAFYRRFPGSTGLTQVSLPAVSPDGRQAVAAVSNQRAGRQGHTTLYLLTHENGAWRVHSTMDLRIS